MSAHTDAIQELTRALRRVIDPNSNRDVVELGWVRTADLDDGVAKLELELPDQVLGSPIENEIRNRANAALLTAPGVRDVAITTRPRPMPRATNTLPGVRDVIAVGAGKGGVGKSTLAVLLAIGMKRRGLKAGVLDADVYGPSVPKLTGTEGCVPEADELGRILPPLSDDGLPVMSMGFLIPPEQAVVWRGPMAQKYVKEFLDRGHWGELDFLFVDLPPGTGDIPLTLAQTIPLTGAVVVCTPQDVALIDALRALRMYQKLGVEPLGFVENMSYYLNPVSGAEEYIFGKGGVERAARKNGVPFLGGLPLAQLIRESGDAGTPMDCFAKSPPHVSKALDEIVDRLLVQVEKRRGEGTPLPQLRVN